MTDSKDTAPEIKRFTSSDIMWSMEGYHPDHSPNGEWVRYEDCMTMVATAYEAAQAVAFNAISEMGEPGVAAQVGDEIRALTPDDATAALEAAKAEAARDAVQIVLDDMGYTYNQLGADARAMVPDPAIRAEAEAEGNKE